MTVYITQEKDCFFGGESGNVPLRYMETLCQKWKIQDEAIECRSEALLAMEQNSPEFNTQKQGSTESQSQSWWSSLAKIS